MNIYQVFVTHSAYAPMVDITYHAGLGCTTWESTVLSQKKWDSKHPVYTSGHIGNPDHLWEISDFIVSNTVHGGTSHRCKGFVVFYYSPANREAVIRDCCLDKNDPQLIEDIFSKPIDIPE